MSTLFNGILFSADVVIQAAILLFVVWVCRRHGSDSPFTARWLIVAALCRAIELIDLFLINLVYLMFLQGELQSHGSTLATVVQLIWWLNVGLEIASWSLIAWAILMRPDERRHEPVV